MIKRLIIVVMLGTTLLASNIDKQIELSQTKLDKKDKEVKKLNRSLSSSVKKIRQQKKRLQGIDAKLKEVQKSTKESVELFNRLEKEHTKLKLDFDEMEIQKRQVEQKLTALITNQLVFLSYVNKEQIGTQESVVNEEISKVVFDESKKRVRELKEQFMLMTTKKESMQTKLASLTNQLDRLKADKEALKKAKKDKKELLSSLIDEKARYKKRLKRLSKERDALRDTLSKYLASINKGSSSNDNVKIKKYGSSYMKSKTSRYKGKKKSPPIANADLTKKFGSYTDPIYGIKVFNESIELTPRGSNVKVRNVLAGKVVLVKNTPYLGNVVIIQHKGNMHTIYAHLDKVAPTIKKGASIKEGYTIGRVDERLTFEVTKKDAHINPLELIKL